MKELRIGKNVVRDTATIEGIGMLAYKRLSEKNIINIQLLEGKQESYNVPIADEMTLKLKDETLKIILEK